jgi:hypothetical protein
VVRKVEKGRRVSDRPLWKKEEKLQQGRSEAEEGKILADGVRSKRCNLVCILKSHIQLYIYIKIKKNFLETS